MISSPARIATQQGELIIAMASRLSPIRKIEGNWAITEICENTFVVDTSGVIEPTHWYLFCLNYLYPLIRIAELEIKGSRVAGVAHLKYTDMDDYELMHIAFFAEDGLVDYLYTKYKALLEKGFKQMTYD